MRTERQSLVLHVFLKMSSVSEFEGLLHISDEGSNTQFVCDI